MSCHSNNFCTNELLFHRKGRSHTLIAKDNSTSGASHLAHQSTYYSSNHAILNHPTTLTIQQFPSAPYFFPAPPASAFFFGPNIGSPILLPVNRTFAAFCNFRSVSMGGKSAGLVPHQHLQIIISDPARAAGLHGSWIHELGMQGCM